MRTDSWPIALLLAVVLFGAGWFGLTMLTSMNLANDAWMSPETLGAGVESSSVDPFAADTGQTADPIAIARDNLSKLLNKQLFWLMAGGALLAIVWAGIAAAAAPRVATPDQETGQRKSWFVLLLLLLVWTAVIGWMAAADPPVARDMSSNGFVWLCAIAAVLQLLLFWLATAWPTPNRLRASVPGSDLFPQHRRR